MPRYAVTDVHEPSDAEILDRSEDEIREQRHAEFVLTIARWGIARTAQLATLLVSQPRYRSAMPVNSLERTIRDFEETEGMSGVFACLARALREAGR